MAKGNMEIKISLTDLEPFKDVVNILDEFIHDERINEGIRTEYARKIITAVGEGE